MRNVDEPKRQAPFETTSCYLAVWYGLYLKFTEPALDGDDEDKGCDFRENFLEVRAWGDGQALSSLQ